MSIGTLLKECSQKGISLKPSDGSHIEIYGPKAAVTPEMVAELKENKLPLLTVLNVLETFEGEIMEENLKWLH